MKKFYTLVSLIAIVGINAQYATPANISKTSIKSQKNGDHDKEITKLFEQPLLEGADGLPSIQIKGIDATIAVADDFEIPNNSKITKVTAYGYSLDPAGLTTETTDFIVYIFEDNGATPNLPKQKPKNAYKTIKISKNSPAIELRIKDEAFVDIIVDLTKANQEIILDGGKRYWFTILPVTAPTSSWNWIRSLESKYSGALQIIDESDFFGAGYTEWTQVSTLFAGWENNGLAFSIEGENNLGVTEVVASNIISLYPNPVADVVNIKSIANITVEEISVFDATGKIVRNNKNQNSINVSGLSSGVYLVKIKDQNAKVYTEKLIKK